jgi:hypothetical protein
MNVDRNILQERLQTACEALTINDDLLLEYDAAERAISSKLAAHLTGLFPSYDVDVEYNREGHEQDPKHLQLPPECTKSNGRVCPDIVVHKRGHDERNLLVIEVKKSTNNESRLCDRIKVEAMMRQKHYRFGVLLTVPAGRDWKSERFKTDWI